MRVAVLAFGLSLAASAFYAIRNNGEAMFICLIFSSITCAVLIQEIRRSRRR